MKTIRLVFVRVLLFELNNFPISGRSPSIGTFCLLSVLLIADQAAEDECLIVANNRFRIDFTFVGDEVRGTFNGTGYAFHFLLDDRALSYCPD